MDPSWRGRGAAECPLRRTAERLGGDPVGWRSAQLFTQILYHDRGLLLLQRGRFGSASAT